MQKLRKSSLGKEEFPQETLDWIVSENLWNLWVPECYGGLEANIADGLKKLRSLAQIDGSLGWTVTLCSGANFFIGNLDTKVANQIFIDPKEPVCFGGSGGVFGTAEKDGDGYVINGKWKYATGAPYLTHFTLNARIQENGSDLVDEDGNPVMRSFLIDKEDVKIIKDWKTMGLKATATHSFDVNAIWVHGKYSFVYNVLHQPHSIFKIPFAMFADLTLWVNYVGMAAHFLEEAENISKPSEPLYKLLAIITDADYKIMHFAGQIQKVLDKQNDFSEVWEELIHKEASDSVKLLSEAISKVYPLLGIKACSENQPLNQIFKDYFTATQHHIFTKKGKGLM